MSDVIERTLEIVRLLYDLKEDVLHDADNPQAAFDAGMLDAALYILEANLDADDERVKAEAERHIDRRLLWALTQAKTVAERGPV